MAIYYITMFLLVKKRFRASQAITLGKLLTFRDGSLFFKRHNFTLNKYYINIINPWAVYCEGPPSFIWRGEEGVSKNWGPIYSSLQLTYTFKMPTKHYSSLQLTYTFKTQKTAYSTVYKTVYLNSSKFWGIWYQKNIFWTWRNVDIFSK